MPRIIDRRTGRSIGTLSEQEWVQLMALLEEPTDDEMPAPIDRNRWSALPTPVRPTGC